MHALLFVPLAAQAATMLVDEGVHHRRRGLPRWERIGHPLDTLTTAACCGWLLAVRPSRASAAAFVALAAFSCLFVTKDERVHARVCSAAEHWTHALLFMLHPIVLGVAAFAWWTGERAIVDVQLALAAGFAVYQALYWNGPWRRA